MWKESVRLCDRVFVVGFLVTLNLLVVILLATANKPTFTRRSGLHTNDTTIKPSNSTSILIKHRLETFYTNMSDVFYPRIHVLWPSGFIITLKEHKDWGEIEFHANINEPYNPLNYSDVSGDLRPVKYNGEWYWMFGTHEVTKKVRCLDKVDYCMYVTPPERDEKVTFRLRRQVLIQCYGDIFVQ